LFIGLISWVVLGSKEIEGGQKVFLDDQITMFILYDNNLFNKKLKSAWGFSCLIKLSGRTILFDTGGDSPILLANMEKLGVDPREVDTVFLSHIHGDHVGGLAGFLKKNSQVTLYLPASFPQKFKEVLKSLGVKVKEVEKGKAVFANVYTSGELGEGIKEQSLIIKTGKGLIVVTGCAHPGVVNVIKKAMDLTGDKVYLILGGFHLAGYYPARIENIIDSFLKLGVKKVCPCHCTGEKALALFEERYGADYFECGVGRRILVVSI